MHNIRYIVYIDPKSYTEKASFEIKQSLGRIVCRLNRNLEIKEGRVMMMGLGRWGSTNIMLGVNTTYADISNASVLVEMAKEQAGHIPDVSYGTHFFLDIVESRMIYLPVYPDDSKSDFNFEFENSPNALGRFLHGAERFEEFVKVIDVPMSAGNMCAHVMADPRKDCALCWLHTAEPEGRAEAGSSSSKTDSNT